MKYYLRQAPAQISFLLILILIQVGQLYPPHTIVLKRCSCAALLDSEGNVIKIDLVGAIGFDGRNDDNTTICPDNIPPNGVNPREDGYIYA
jgi:hypothetical protein